VSQELDERPGDVEPPDPRTAAIAGGCLYSVLLAGSVFWLALRDRLALVPAVALGVHGVAIAAGTGCAVGLVGYLAFAHGLCRQPTFVAMAEQVRRLLAGASQGPLLALVLVGAVSEEMFFRVAVQDQFGLVGSVATYSIVATGAMGWRWLPFAALHATALGGLMALGFGLLATTVANAVMNYLMIQRMLNR